jgi:sodium/proline symporter
MIIISFSFFLLLFIALGALSSLKSKKTTADYLLASRGEKNWMIALAAVATNNSGYMFIGMIGYTYLKGISVFWIMLCVLIGDFCASLFVYKKLRIASEKLHALSFCETLSKWSGSEYKIFRKISAAILILFLSTYAAAQLHAGGKAIHVLFNVDYAIGSIIGGIVVLIYCSFGGIRASIWTNTLQSFVMIISMGILFFSALHEVGGFAAFIAALQNISPEFVSLFPSDLIGNKGLGLLLFIFGWFFGGFGIIGQPHIMTSFMAVAKPQDIKEIRLCYYTWYVAFFALTIGTGLAARLLIPFDAGFDPELALPMISNRLLPDFLIGLILAGLFSATMSTADSQILSCSAALTNDLLAGKRVGYLATKGYTVAISTVVIAIAVANNQSVFSLVMISWLALACCFTPIVIIFSLGKKMSQKMAITSMFSGFLVMMLWRYLGLGEIVYEAAPGILAGIAPYFFHSLSKKIRTKI